MPDTRRPSRPWTATPPGTAPRHPRGMQPPTGHASQGNSAGPQHPHIRAHSTWVADPDSPPRGRAAGGGRAPELRRPPLTTAKGTPPGDALPPPPQRAAAARKSARCVTSDGSPRQHQPHPGHRGRGAPAACPTGRAAGGGEAPDIRHPSPGDGPPPPPRHADTHKARKLRKQCWALAPAHPRPQPGSRGGRAPESGRPSQRRQGPWLPKPTPTTPGTHGSRNPGRPPLKGRAAGGGTAPDARRPQQRWKTIPPGQPPTTPMARSPPRGMEDRGTVLGPHTQHVGGGPGEGQRLNPDAISQRHKATPPGGALPPPPQHATTAREGTSMLRGWCWIPTPTTTAPGKHGPRSPGPTPHGTGDGGRPPPQGRPPTGPAARSTPQGMQAKGTESAGPPRPRTRARNTRIADPDSPPRERAAGEGRATDLRRLWQLHRAARATRTTGGAPDAHTSTQTPGREANIPSPHPRPTPPIARAPAAGNPHPIPCS